MLIQEEMVLMRIFVGENDRFQKQPLYEALVELFLDQGVAGATVIKGAMGLVDEFILHRPDTFTRRGIVAECRRVIQDHNVNHLEGAILLDEGSSVFTSRTGTETIMQFLIKAGELDNITDFTGYLGAQQLTGFTLGFAISS